jgi:hypothetical protein
MVAECVLGILRGCDVECVLNETSNFHYIPVRLPLPAAGGLLGTRLLQDELENFDGHRTGQCPRREVSNANRSGVYHGECCQGCHHKVGLSNDTSELRKPSVEMSWHEHGQENVKQGHKKLHDASPACGENGREEIRS